MTMRFLQFIYPLLHDSCGQLLRRAVMACPLDNNSEVFLKANVDWASNLFKLRTILDMEDIEEIAVFLCLNLQTMAFSSLFSWYRTHEWSNECFLIVLIKGILILYISLKILWRINFIKFQSSHKLTITLNSDIKTKNKICFDMETMNASYKF